MDHTEQTVHPAVLTAAEPAFGPGWLLLARTPKGPSEERLLGTRTVLISLTGATADQLQRAANETLNLFDRDASASPAERARRALTAAQNYSARRWQLVLSRSRATKFSLRAPAA